MQFAEKVFLQQGKVNCHLIVIEISVENANDTELQIKLSS